MPDRSEKHPRLILAATILASSLAFIDGSVLNIALPAIGRGLGAATAEKQWFINAFLLPLSALMLLGGAAGDLYGRRRLLISGTVLFTAASLLCAVAPNVELFLAGRAMQGIGAAILLPSSLAILGNSFEGERRGRAVGIWAAAGAVAGALGPLLGGWLIDAVGWRSIFLINVPVAGAMVYLALRFVPESSNPKKPPPDWSGAIAATLGLGALTWGLTEWSASQGLRSAALASIMAGAAMLLVFILVERRKGDRAMVPLQLFGSREFVGLTILTFLLYGAFGGLLILLPYTLIEAAGYSALGAGAALLPLPIVIALGSPLMGKVAARIGSRWPLTVGPLVGAVGFLLAARVAQGASYWTSVLPMVAVVSIGLALAVAPLTTAVLASVGARHTGAASALNSSAARVGGLIATACLGVVLTERGNDLIASFHSAALVGSVLALAASLSAFALLRARQAG